MSQGDDSSLGCSAGCKRAVADEAEAMQAGWERLAITGRWRCGTCSRELAEVNARTKAAEANDEA